MAHGVTPRDSQGVDSASGSMTGRTEERQLRISRALGTGGLTASGLEPGGEHLDKGATDA